MASRLLTRRAPRSLWTTYQGRKYSSVSGINAVPTRVTNLSTGLRVATEEGFGETAAVGIYIDAGSAYETEKTNGVAHFLEHLAFKGTASRSKAQIESEIESVGAQLSAHTGRERTSFVAQSFKKDVPKMLELLSDILQNSAIREADIEAEKNVILQEKEASSQNLSQVLIDHLHSAAYQGTSHALTVLGEAESIQNMKREHILNYLKTHYTAPRMVVVGTGGVRHDELVQLSEKLFSGLSTVNHAPPNNRRVQYTGSEIRIRSDDMHDAHVAIGFESVGWAHPHYFTTLIIQALIGSWSRYHAVGANAGTRLAEMVAQEDLARSFDTFNTHYNNTGLFGVYAISHPGEKFGDLVYEIFNEFQRLGSYIAADELQRAKHKVKTTILSSLNGNVAVADDIGRQVLTLGRRMTPAEVSMRIDAIQPNDVKECLEVYFNDVCPTVVGLGPIADLPDYHYMRSWTYWNRL